MEIEPSESSNPAVTHRIGQACDRCRKKKLKCDGTFPKCRRCENGGHTCEASTSLRRRTKVRGFTSDEQRLEQLQTELARCHQLLKLEREKNEALYGEISRQEQSSVPQGIESRTFQTSEIVAASRQEQRPSDDSAYVIKHMGRLVRDERGVGRFAGSTTGVHFVLTVEKECQKTLHMTCGFPESCFRLFLVPSLHESYENEFQGPSQAQARIYSCFEYPLVYYHEQADLFIKRWEPFCPVFVRNEVFTDIEHLIKTVHTLDFTAKLDSQTAMTLLIVLCINDLQDNDKENPNPRFPKYGEYLSLASGYINEVAMKADIKSLQALILFAFHSQLSGDCLSMTRINGLIVNLAQSLGLHRHARRFKMKPGEVELRKRLWWFVYVFDTMASLCHGLPALINDADVDNDLPSDCSLHGLEAADILYPFPGENTGAFVFIQYVRIGRILSRVREKLYTTTKRRNGAVKIKDLAFDLRMWAQDLRSYGINLDIESIPAKSSPGPITREFSGSNLWLQMLGNVAMVLINRPGLSFDDRTAEFSECLLANAMSTGANLILLEESRPPLWLRNLSMVGPGMVFQSALMHVYYQCYSPTMKPEEGPSLETSLRMISHGISTLERDNAMFDLPPAGVPQPSSRESLSEVIEVLKLLQALLVQRGQITASSVASFQDASFPHGSVMLSEQDWGTDALEMLNYVSATDWAYEVPGPFMGFPDVDL